MADAEFEARRLAELLADANRQLEHFGEVNKATADQLVDAQMKAKYGINNYTAVTKTAGEALGALASAGISAGKSMLEGKKGAAALNSSLDDLAKAATIAGTALTLLMPGGILIKGVVAAFTAVTAATIGSVKAANEMADKLYKGYSGLAKSGGAAADGMTGVFNNAKKLGLSMNELDGFVSLINENSTDLAQFSGSVADGRKRLADMGDALRGSRQGFLAMGLSMQDVSEGMANYMRIQTRTGNLQERSARDQAAAAKEYIYQQDALAKITGMSVKEQQKQREAALTEQMFLAKVRQLQAQGRFEEAEELQKMNIMLAATSDEHAKGFRAMVTGRLQDESARKLLMSTNAEAGRVIEGLSNGSLKASQGFNQLAVAQQNNLARQGDQAALLGTHNAVMSDYAGSVKLASYANRDMTELEKKAIAERQAQVAGADAITKNQAELMNRQINTNEKMERALFGLIPSAQNVMLTMQHGADMVATAFEKIVKAIDDILKALGKFGIGVAKVINAEGAEAKLKASGEAGLGETLAGVATGVAGAKGGAAFGAGLGTVLLPGIGTAVGAALGGLLGGASGFFAGRGVGRAADAAAQEKSFLEQLKAMFTGEKLLSSDVPQAASGGVLTGPTSGYLAMLHGTEIVLPIKNMGKKIEEAASGKNIQDVMEGLGNDKLKDNATRIGNYITDISNDLMLQTVAFEKDAKNVKKFSDFQETYQRKMTDYMKEVLDLCEDNKPEEVIGTAGSAVTGTTTGGTPGGGGGILGKMMQAFASIMGTDASSAAGMSSQPAAAMPAAAMPAASASQGPEPHGTPVAAGGAPDAKPKLTRVTSKTGKSTAVNADFAPRFQGIIDYLDSVGYNIYSLGGYVDRDVRGQPGKKSVHAYGGAIDINPAENPFGSQLITDMPAEIGQVAAKLGLGWGGNWRSVKDAMHFSVAEHEGGTVKLSDGGVLTGPDSGYRPNIEMHGTEAVIPLKDGAVPVSFTGSMSLPSEAMALFQQMANQSAGMMAMMEEMVRAQRNSVDVQQKMLRTANS